MEVRGDAVAWATFLEFSQRLQQTLHRVGVGGIKRDLGDAGFDRLIVVEVAFGEPRIRWSRVCWFGACHGDAGWAGLSGRRQVLAGREFGMARAQRQFRWVALAGPSGVGVAGHDERRGGLACIHGFSYRGVDPAGARPRPPESGRSRGWRGFRAPAGPCGRRWWQRRHPSDTTGRRCHVRGEGNSLSTGRTG